MKLRVIRQISAWRSPLPDLLKSPRLARWLLAFTLVFLGLPSTQVSADIFRVRLSTGGEEEIEARLAGTGQGAMALELADGQFRIVAEGAVVERKIQEGPQPLSGDEVARRLVERFGDDLTFTLVKEPYVYVLVVGTPLPRASEARAKNFLQRVASFFKNVDHAFANFAKEAKLRVEAPTHLLPVLIFETQPDFEKYAQSITGGQGLSVGRISGFYSGITNMLAIRLAECRTFEVPLHEAIHQLSYNRNIFQRVSAVPHWFDEGLATGFEANQGKVSIGPTLVSPRYARQVRGANRVSFESILQNDQAFAGDVLAGEAYGRAWALHWLLVTKYRAQYGAYVRILAAKQTLAKEDPEQRLADFREAFGKTPAEVERDFRTTIEPAIKKQKVVIDPEKPKGISVTHENVGTVEMSAVNRADEAGSRLEVQGKLTNVSPLRAMAFHVTVETDAGTYAEWHVPSLDSNKSSNLAGQVVTKRMRGGRGGNSRTFRVRIRSAPADSAEAAAWKEGKLPVPAVD